MTSHIDIWESKEAYEYYRNWNGIGDEPDEPLFSFAYDDFEFLEKFIEKHPKFWEMWEIFQVAAWAERERENESWKGLHRDHDNLKFFSDDTWKLTECSKLAPGTKAIGVFYINK